MGTPCLNTKSLYERVWDAIYGYETRYFTRQVNNNIERFEQDFRFQLTKEEFENLMC